MGCYFCVQIKINNWLYNEKRRLIIHVPQKCLKINNWLYNEKRLLIIHVPQECLEAIVLSVTRLVRQAGLHLQLPLLGAPPLFLERG